MFKMRKKEPSKFNRIVRNQLGEVKGNLLVAAVCMIGYTLTELLAPWPFKIIFDHVLLGEPLPSSLSFLKGIFQRGETFSLVIFSLSIFLIAICKGLFSYLQIYMTSRIGYRVVDTLRRELFGHLQRLSLSFHNRARSGELLTKVTGDTNILKDVFAGSALTFASHLFTIIGMFAIMLAMNWKLTLIVLATLPILSYVLFYLYGKIKASAQTQRRKEGKVASRLNEILASVSLVQAFGREKYEKERFETESAETFEESIRTARMEAATTRTVEVVSAVGVCAVVFFGSFQSLQGRMTPGEVLVFIAYLNNMYKPIRNLARLSAKFVRAKVSAERISEILEIEPEIQDRPDAIEASDLKGEIVFKEVSFDYGGGRDVLRKVSFSILPGQKVALVGASGAGKSTIVNLLLRLYDPQGGAILIDGIDIKRYRRESLRREIGIVLQDSILFGATVKENISYGKPQATQEEIEAAARRAHAHDFIIALPDGYDTVLGERGSTLSGGQRQRISLARALIKEPSILVLDEPTSAVDAESATLIQEAFINFQKGRTILVIVHQFSAIKHFDQIFVLKDGEVVEQGTHHALLERKGHYHQLFEFQLR